MYESRQEILLIGDFNIDMLVREHGDDPENNSLMDFCDRFCLQNQISEPTRVTEKTIGSLSNSVFERRTSTGSGLFASLGSGSVETLG